MHIVLALAGSIITILILFRRLNDSGFTLDSINPFAWYRRHQWLKRYHTKPIFTIDDPQRVAALFVVSVAHADGMVSLDEKKQILDLFEHEFGLSRDEASGLLTSSIFFIKDELDLVPLIPNILKLTAAEFTQNQVKLTLDCMQKIADLDPENMQQKQKIMTQFDAYFKKLNQKSTFQNA